MDGASWQCSMFNARYPMSNLECPMLNPSGATLLNSWLFQGHCASLVLEAHELCNITVFFAQFHIEH
jgi:hypothetical protein